MQPLQICIGPIIRIGRESWCLPYAGFFYTITLVVGCLMQLNTSMDKYLKPFFQITLFNLPIDIAVIVHCDVLSSFYSFEHVVVCWPCTVCHLKASRGSQLLVRIDGLQSREQALGESGIIFLLSPTFQGSPSNICIQLNSPKYFHRNVLK